MTTVNLIILILPVIFAMVMLWVHCVYMDNLPKRAYEDKRVHLRWGFIFLVMLLLAMIFFMVLSISVIQQAHPLPVNGI